MYKYKYSDVSCKTCAEKQKAKCKRRICPHIMENLTDLLDDRAFCNAVKNAEKCSTYHKMTLLSLKTKGYGK